jgi:hypothetical protein
VAPLAKLDRADEHLHKLKCVIQRFVEDKPYRLVSEFQMDGRKRVYVAKDVKQPADDIGLILGDCVHNLRSALDHVVWALSDPVVRDRQTSFPIFVDRNDFFRRAKNGEGAGKPGWGSGLHKLAGVSKEAFAVIEAAQPYHAGNDAPTQTLAVLDHLDITDKHKLLNNGVAAANPTGMDLSSGGTGKRIGFRLWAGLLEEDTVVAEFTCPNRKAAMEMNFDFAARVAFGETAEVATGWPVVETLEGIRNDVALLLADLA